jgi:hypothetical protein
VVANASCAAINALRKVKFDKRVIPLTENEQYPGYAAARLLIAHLPRTCQRS